jgi:histidinol phosphatase-like enzyme (inositol monophosphatase family)
MQTDDLKKTLEFASRIAQEAGKVTLEYFATDFSVDRKSDQSPVTIADRKAEETLRALIAREFPDHGILGEEFGEINEGAEYRWIVDPIDGTRSFIRSVPLYGVLVALEYKRDALLGVIHHPVLEETVRAAKGCGCEWNGRPARVSDIGELEQAMILSTDSAGVYRKNPGFGDRLFRSPARHRTWGDCYGYTLVATGRAEAMMDPEMSLWDSAALKPVIEEAGGVFSDWSGERTIYCADSLATNGAVHDSLLEMIGRKD